MAAAKLIDVVRLYIRDLFCGTCVETRYLQGEMSEVSLLVTSCPTLSTRGLPVAYGLARAAISRAEP